MSLLEHNARKTSVLEQRLVLEHSCSGTCWFWNVISTSLYCQRGTRRLEYFWEQPPDSTSDCRRQVTRNGRGKWLTNIVKKCTSPHNMTVPLNKRHLSHPWIHTRLQRKSERAAQACVHGSPKCSLSRVGRSGMWCFRVWGLKIIVLNPSPISALGVKSPQLQLLTVNKHPQTNTTSSNTTSLNSLSSRALLSPVACARPLRVGRGREHMGTLILIPTIRFQDFSRQRKKIDYQETWESLVTGTRGFGISSWLLGTSWHGACRVVRRSDCFSGSLSSSR